MQMMLVLYLLAVFLVPILGCWYDKRHIGSVTVGDVCLGAVLGIIPGLNWYCLIVICWYYFEDLCNGEFKCFKKKLF